MSAIVTTATMVISLNSNSQIDSILKVSCMNNTGVVLLIVCSSKARNDNVLHRAYIQTG